MKYLKHLTLALAIFSVPLLSAGAPTALAQCLSDKKVEVYSAWWCPYCFMQRKEIDPSFTDRNMMKDKAELTKRFPFVRECGGEKIGSLTLNCVPAVENRESGTKRVGVPTTQLQNGDLSVGYMDIEGLVTFTGCSAPKK